MLQARFEHVRPVILRAEARPEVMGLPNGVAMVTEPVLMNAHEWRKCREEGFDVEVLPTGGLTRCRLYKLDEDQERGMDELIAMGETWCSEGDNYVKALGRVKSLGRARSALEK